MNLGEKIGYWAEKKNMSIRQLAYECKINYNTLYSFIKRGGKNLPSEQLLAITLALGVPFVVFEEDPTEEEPLSDAEKKLFLTLDSVLYGLDGKKRDCACNIITEYLKETNTLLHLLVDGLSEKEEV